MVMVLETFEAILVVVASVTPQDVGPCFRRNFIPRRPNLGKNQPGLPNPNPKPTPAWQRRNSYVFGSSAMSQANDYFFARKRKNLFFLAFFFAR